MNAVCNGTCYVVQSVKRCTENKMLIKRDELSFKKLLHVCRVSLRLSGIITVDQVFDDTNAPSTRKSVGYFVYYVIGLITTNFLVICMLRKIINDAATSTHLALEASNAFLTGILIVVRGLQLFYFRSEIKDLLGKLTVLWDDKLARNIDDYSGVVEIVKFATLATKFYVGTIVVGALMYMAQPLGTLFYNLVIFDFENISPYATTGIPAIYPFSTDTLATYIGCLMGESCAFIYNCSFCIASDSLLVQLVAHVSAQLKILAQDLTELGKQANANLDKAVLTERLNSIGRRHCDLINHCHAIKRIYSPVIFFNILLTAVNLCICMKLIFQGWSAASYGQILQYTVHCLLFIIMATFNCASAQMLIDNTEDLAVAAYNCEWYEHQQCLQDSVRLIMMMAQRGYDFNVYGFYRLNMAQLTYIFHAAISYRTLLRHLESKSKR